jgi:hypothetical protein
VLEERDTMPNMYAALFHVTRTILVAHTAAVKTSSSAAIAKVSYVTMVKPE